MNVNSISCPKNHRCYKKGKLSELVLYTYIYYNIYYTYNIYYIYTIYIYEWPGYTNLLIPNKFV